MKIIPSLIFLVWLATCWQGTSGNLDSSAELVEEAYKKESRGENASALWIQAADMGNETAQFAVGVMYAWGLNGLERDDAKAVLNYYFSALGGYVPAQMALGYRHSRGTRQT